jgi:hypothetical protein
MMKEGRLTLFNAGIAQLVERPDLIGTKVDVADQINKKNC